MFSSLLLQGCPQTPQRDLLFFSGAGNCVPTQFLDLFVETSGKADVNISTQTPSPGSCDRKGDNECSSRPAGALGPWLCSSQQHALRRLQLCATPRDSRRLSRRLFNVNLNIHVNSCFSILYNEKTPQTQTLTVT